MTLKDLDKQVAFIKGHVEKSTEHLQYSYKKIKLLGPGYDIEDLEILETYESFTSRFLRLSDIITRKLLRVLVLKDDPSYSGGFMDFLNQSEKLSFITDARKWWIVRSLRNKEAQEYTAKDLVNYFEDVKLHTDFVLHEARALVEKI